MASEEPFVDSDNYDAYDRLSQQTGFIPPLTMQQITLLSNVSTYYVHEDDPLKEVNEKDERRKPVS